MPNIATQHLRVVLLSWRVQEHAATAGLWRFSNGSAEARMEDDENISEY